MAEQPTLDDVLRRLVHDELEAQLAPIRERLERPRGALRPDEAADYLGVGETTIRELIAAGELGAVSIGLRGKRIPIAELDRWLTDHTRRGRGVA